MNKIIILVIGLIASSSIFASKHMVSVRGTAAGVYFNNNGDYRHLIVNADYHYTIDEKIQIGSTISLSLYKSDYSDGTFTEVGPSVIYNLDSNINESAFIKAKILLFQSSSTDSSTTSYTLSLGKRFKIFESVSLAPEIFISTNSDVTAYGVDLINVNIFF